MIYKAYIPRFLQELAQEWVLENEANSTEDAIYSLADLLNKFENDIRKDERSNLHDYLNARQDCNDLNTHINLESLIFEFKKKNK